MADILNPESYLQFLMDLEAKCLANPNLQKEWEQARQLFEQHAGHDAHAAHRFREWFLLERSSPSLGVAPAMAWAPDAPEPGSLWFHLLDAFYGIFFSFGKDAKGFCILEDLWTGRQIRLRGQEINLDDGTLLIGRVALGEGEFHLPLPGAVFLAVPGLAEAIRSDLAELKAKYPRAKLSQWECERMLQPFRTSPCQENANQTVEEILAQGVEDLSLEGFEKMVQEFGLGETLNHLAFHTNVDLDALRLACSKWQASTPAEKAESKTEQEQWDANQALHHFDQARAEGKSLEESFAILESNLGLEKGTSDPYVDILKADTEDEKIGPHDEDQMALCLATYLWELELHGKKPSEEIAKTITGLLSFLNSVQEKGFHPALVQQHHILAYLCLAENGQGLAERLTQLEPFILWLQEEQAAALDWNQESKNWVEKVVHTNQRLAADKTQASATTTVTAENPVQVQSEQGEPIAVVGWPTDLGFTPRVGDALRGHWHGGKFHITAWYPQALLPQTENRA